MQQQQQQTFKVWQPQRAARLKRPNTPYDNIGMVVSLESKRGVPFRQYEGTMKLQGDELIQVMQLLDFSSRSCMTWIIEEVLAGTQQ